MTKSFNHGLSGYSSYKCKCDICKKAGHEYEVGRRDKKSAYNKIYRTSPEGREIVNKKNSEYNKRYGATQTGRTKLRAREAVRVAIRNGLKKSPCLYCGDKNTEAHHEDYSKPLGVEWYCFKHHRELHKWRDHV